MGSCCSDLRCILSIQLPCVYQIACRLASVNCISPPLIINIVELIGILLISVGKQGVDLSLPLSGSKRGLYNVLCTYRFTAMWQAASNLYHAEMGQNPYHKRL